MQRLVLGALFIITAGVIVFIVAMIFLSAQRLPLQPPAVATAPGASALLIPVAGVEARQLADTFAQARAGGRPHDAIDIMAPRGTAVVAAADGIVEKLYFSRGGGGLTVYVRSRDRRWIHYYAHLDAYAAGLAEGRRVARGDPIGTVGSTGNANPAGPHLHFAIHRMGPEERWWQGGGQSVPAACGGRTAPLKPAPTSPIQRAFP